MSISICCVGSVVEAIGIPKVVEAAAGSPARDSEFDKMAAAVSLPLLLMAMSRTSDPGFTSRSTAPISQPIAMDSLALKAVSLNVSTSPSAVMVSRVTYCIAVKLEPFESDRPNPIVVAIGNVGG